MNRSTTFLLGCLAWTCAAFAPAISAQTTTYTYTGAPYSIATAPYSVGGNLQGSLTLAGPLPAFLPLTDISAAIVGFSFDDEADTRTLGNSLLCSFKVATNGAGNITQWEIRLQRFPFNAAAHHEIYSDGRVGVVAGIDILATGTAAVPCGPVTATGNASSGAQGSWVSSQPLPSNPTTYTYNGGPYSAATAPYVIGGNLAGTVSLANPLPAFMPLTDISPALVAFSLSDDVETRTLADSYLCSFKVATDGMGRITQWDIRLQEFPLNPADHSEIISNGAVGVIAGIDFVTKGTGALVCGPLTPTSSANTNAQGTWTSSNPLPSNPTTYTYTGGPYTSATAPYVAGGNLQGTLSLANPLPPFLPLTDISPAIVAFSFSDEVETRTLADSYLCNFRVATDGMGRITQWEIRLQAFPLNPADHSEMSSSGEVGVIAGVDIATKGTGALVCGAITATSGANTSSQGSWISSTPLPSNPTTYTYVGDPYTSATPPYALGGSLQGTLTLANPLPAFRPLGDITPAIVSFTFTDGAETRTLPSSYLCVFDVGTDGLGRITAWRVVLRRSPYNPGDPHHGVDSEGGGGIDGQGTDQVGTGSGPAGPCDPMAFATAAAGTGSQGTWIRGQLPGNSVAVPVFSPLGGIALAWLLALFGMAKLAGVNRRKD